MQFTTYTLETRYESGSNKGTCHEVHAAVRHPHDFRGSIAAVLEHRRHADRRAISWARCACSGRLRLYADDLSDLHHPWPVYGERRTVFHAIWAAG